MNFRNLSFTNYLLFLLLTLILTSLQCSLWMQFFGYFPAPQMWIPTLAYWAIYRDTGEGLIMAYLIVVSTISLSAVPLSLFLGIVIICFLLAKLIKERIYWRGTTYLTLISLVLALAFPLLHYLLSWAFEPVRITDPEALDNILSALLTALMSLPLYFLYAKIDELTKKDLPTDVGASSYE